MSQDIVCTLGNVHPVLLSLQDKEPLDEKKTFRLVTKVESCDDASYLLHTSFRGKLGKTGLPEKQGTLESVTGTRTHAGGACIKVEPSIQSISGQFLSGKKFTNWRIIKN
jgi:hypothetical protein